MFPNNFQEKYNAHRHEIELHIGYPWKFNEIIGWVLLNIDGEIFSGELFYKEGKRVTKGSKSKVVYNSEAFRFDIFKEMNNITIYSKILTELKALNKKSLTKGRFIDTSRFETVGEYINWKKLFADLNY